MNIQEAIDELILNVSCAIINIEEYERHPSGDDDDREMYESYKRDLEAYLVIFGQLDPTLSTLEGLKERCRKVEKERCGDVEEEPIGEIEAKIYSILNPWYEKEVENNDGYATELKLSEDENKILAKINIKDVTEGIDEELNETDTFDFYPYNDRVYVIFNGYADIPFSEFSTEFHEKALEFIKKHI